MALEIIHTGRSYTVVDNEQGHWTPQHTHLKNLSKSKLIARYLNAKHCALVWKQVAKFYRQGCY